MGRNEHAPIDATTIRQTCEGVLWAPFRPEGAELDAFRGRLTGHVQLLIPEVTDIAARMRGITRSTAVHVIVRTHQLLDEGVDAYPAAQACYVYDLATTARALLTLHENPGPLGPPTRRDEIEDAVRRRLCGACSQPIADGEGFERALFASEASGGVRGYLHTDSCADLAEERRKQLRAVP
ncbi:DUF6415 family natural product biosynthesis protein [Streptomyces sp. HC307]|uniref:DUF6415 family natural product biosynthesis protein n=1 Tax=Streptomyces flavusporus TaxID=3385496 RepID=UPI0039171FD1